MDTTTEPQHRVYATPAAFRAAQPTEKIERYRAEIKRTLDFDPLIQPQGIGIADATRLAGVLVGTGNAWVRRTRIGKGLAVPFPTKLPTSPRNKPLYDPLDVAAWLDMTGRKDFGPSV